jgi:hypothetical protein
MHGGELVEQLGVDKLQAGLEQLCANQQCQHTTNDQHSKSKQQIQCANVFVVGGIHPTLPAVRGTVVVVVPVVCCTMAVGIKNCAHKDSLDFRVIY